MAYFNNIKINGTNIYRPNGFTPQRQDVYAAEITTCTGKTIADLIGWKFANMTMQWDALPQDQLEVLLAMSGECTLEFTDADGVARTEAVVRTSAVTTATRFTRNGVPVWSNVQLEVMFLNAHNS